MSSDFSLYPFANLQQHFHSLPFIHSALFITDSPYHLNTSIKDYCTNNSLSYVYNLFDSQTSEVMLCTSNILISSRSSVVYLPHLHVIPRLSIRDSLLLVERIQTNARLFIVCLFVLHILTLHPRLEQYLLLRS